MFPPLIVKLSLEWIESSEESMWMVPPEGREITAAGIDRKEVSQRLFDIYLRQIFEDGFFHADPHPGNLFVEPGEDGWLLTFVDFGMVGHIPPNSRAGLREFAIGLGTQDPERMVKAYQLLNALLPSADIELIKEAEAKVFDRFNFKVGTQALVKKLNTMGILEPYEGGAVAGSTSLFRVNLDKAEEYLDHYHTRKNALKSLQDD